MGCALTAGNLLTTAEHAQGLAIHWAVLTGSQPKPTNKSVATHCSSRGQLNSLPLENITTCADVYGLLWMAPRAVCGECW